MQQALQQRRAGAQVALITVTVMLGLIVAIIDSTIVNVAIAVQAEAA